MKLMKHVRIILPMTIALTMAASCSENSGNKQEENKTVVQAPEVVEKTVVQAPDVLERSDCATCHTENEMLVGPPYSKIAERYPATNETIDTLAQSIIKGGQGKWGTTPMAPHLTMPEQDAKAIAEYIMSLKK